LLKKETPELPSISKTNFERDGFLIFRNCLDDAICKEAKNFVLGSLEPLIGPAELEVDVGYPGAPAGDKEVGSETPRRLLHAYGRAAIMRRMALHENVRHVIYELMEEKSVMLSQCHHNCVMTKFPKYSSTTGWHQDIRYWHFDLPELVSVWIALDREDELNGALQVIPGSHKMDFGRGDFDKDWFFREDNEANQALFEKKVSVELNRGDLLFFHCRLLHSASQNLSSEVKLSPVFTYHGSSNQPIDGTRSARFPSIAV
tara:strand:- start:53 stop:829 length:777 start_codon:yes stop_codon:yes gene_type:complete